MTTTLSDPHDNIELCLLDVGHGSCVFINTGEGTALIDTGPRAAVLEFLRERSITRIDLVVISHADQDHVGGLSAMLSNHIEIGRVIWNTDGLKRTDLWKNLAYQLDALSSAGTTVADEEAAANMAVKDLGERVEIEVHAPRLRLRRLGVGNRDRDGATIGSNTLSVVARVLVDGVPTLVVPGDIDAVGVGHLGDPVFPDLKAKYLVLPHHGGTMGATPAATSAALSSLINAVSPEVTFVSNGRSTRWDNPRPEVLAAVHGAGPGITVACSQLSRSCSPEPILRDGEASSFSAGWLAGHSCAGSVSLTLNNGIVGPFVRDTHEAFINEHVPNARCMRTQEAIARADET